MDFSYFSLITHFQQSIVLFSALAIIDMLQSLSPHCYFTLNQAKVFRIFGGRSESRSKWDKLTVLTFWIRSSIRGHHPSCENAQSFNYEAIVITKSSLYWPFPYPRNVITLEYNAPCSRNYNITCRARYLIKKQSRHPWAESQALPWESGVWGWCYITVSLQCDVMMML